MDVDGTAVDILGCVVDVMGVFICRVEALGCVEAAAMVDFSVIATLLKANDVVCETNVAERVGSVVDLSGDAVASVGAVKFVVDVVDVLSSAVDMPSVAGVVVNALGNANFGCVVDEANAVDCSLNAVDIVRTVVCAMD